MIAKPPTAVARYFSLFFCGCAALLSIIAISGTQFFHVRIETVVLAALFASFAFILPVEHKKRLLHTLLALIFFAIIIDVALLLIELPDMLSKFSIGAALFSLCLSYGANVGHELQPHPKYRDYEVDYQSLIANVRSNGKLMQTALHETTDGLIAKLYREETEKLFGHGKPNSLANIKWELLAQAVLDTIVDGYAIKILELQQSDAQIAKPVMAGMDVMLPLWQKYMLKHAKKPSSDFLKEAIKQLAKHKVRLEQRKAALASVSAFKRTALIGSETALLQLGYKVAEFEDHYRSDVGKHEIEQIEASIEREFFELMGMCQKLPLALDGVQARTILTMPRKFRPNNQQVHLSCISTDADEVIAALAREGVETRVIYRDSTGIRRYQLISEAFTTIDPYIEVYLMDEETGRCSAADMPREHQFTGLADFYHTSLKGHKIKTVPPSFFIQQIIYCWADFPELKEVAWIEDYNILSEKYFSDEPIQQCPLFSYALSYSKTTDEESTFTYNS